jgi:hypothetical protein
VTAQLAASGGVTRYIPADRYRYVRAKVGEFAVWPGNTTDDEACRHSGDGERAGRNGRKWYAPDTQLESMASRWRVLAGTDDNGSVFFLRFFLAG